MKSISMEDRKSTIGSSRCVNTQCQISNGEYQEGQVNVYSPRGSVRNLNSQLTTLKSNRKGVELSVSPRRATLYDGEVQSDQENSIGPSNGSTVHDEAVSRYECIASLTEQQNRNLREQNKYLIEKMRKMQEKESKVRKLYQKAKKYKMLYQQALMQVQALRDECQIYKDQSEQMKKIILNDVYKLKQKVIQTEINGVLNLDEDNCEKTELSKKSQASTQNKSARISSQSSLTKYFRNVEDI